MNFDNLPKHAVQSLERVQKRLWKRKGQLGRWTDVAAEIGVSLGSCVRVANGYYPRTPELCQKFGLPILLLSEICPVHDRVCAVRHRRPIIRRWRDLPIEQLRWAIENRKEYTIYEAEAGILLHARR